MYNQMRTSLVFLFILSVVALSADVSLERRAIKPSQRVFNNKLKEVDTGDGWHEWHHAFQMTDVDSNNLISAKDIPVLYREHFNKIMAKKPHAGNPNAVVREDTDVFLEDAERFQAFVKRSGSNVEEFNWDDFKKMMTNYMHVQADLLNAFREL